MMMVIVPCSGPARRLRVRDAVDVHYSDSRGIRAQPGGECRFRQVAGRQGEHGTDAVGIVSLQLVAVECKKKLGTDKCGTFIAVDERMIACDTEAIGGRQRSSVGLTIVAARLSGRAKAEASKPASRTPVAPPCPASCAS